jgi:hypothetical protein
MPWPLNELPQQIVSIFTSFVPGYRLVDGGDCLDMANLLFTAREEIVGGGGQADAYPLETYISQVVDGNSVLLPPAVPGRYVWVLNDTTTTLEVWGNYFNPLIAGQDQIAPSSASTLADMATQPPGDISEYLCYAPGLWKQASGSAGTGPGGGIPEAPINGVTYGRLNGGWAPVLNLQGGTMTGPIFLAPGPPTDPNSAMSFSHVEFMLANLHIDEGTY